MLFADVASAIILILFAVIVYQNPHPPGANTDRGRSLAFSGQCIFRSRQKRRHSQPGSGACPCRREWAFDGDTKPDAADWDGSLRDDSGGTLCALPDLLLLSSVLLNALSFAVSALFIARLPRLTPQHSPAEHLSSSGIGRAWHDTIDGLRYMKKEHVLRVVFCLDRLSVFYLSLYGGLCFGESGVVRRNVLDTGAL